MRTSAALAVAALLGAAAAQAQPAQPGKPAQPAQPARPATPAAQPGTAAQPADPAERARPRLGDPGGKGAEGRELGQDRAAQAREQAAERRDPAAAGAGQPSAQDEVKLRELRETRAKRRQDRRDALKIRYGLEVLQRPPIRAELRTHAWRMARLDRMRTLAEAMEDAAKRKKALERIDKLLAKEKARHDRHMDHLKTGNDSAMAAGAQPEGAGKPAGAGKPEGAGQPAAPGHQGHQGVGMEKRSDKAGGGQ